MAVKNISASVLTRLKNQAKDGLSFIEAIDRLAIFLEPIYTSIFQNGNFISKWKCESKTWE